ncbi:MAG: hypothetical protein HC930_05380 [Hydrococcus sp. SU_1_0]|jgi:hypothetical protein|nr:hypothetical protein [Hydrococcus sp. SU_1_0]NJL66074.1 hypothetical protein [Microcoleus sp. SM1_3_4]
MKSFIVGIRFPFGVIASIVLIIWTFVLGLWFCIRFSYYAVLGNKRSIENKLIPWFQDTEGTHHLEDVWEWVFNPDSGQDFDDSGN